MNNSVNNVINSRQQGDNSYNSSQISHETAYYNGGLIDNRTAPHFTGYESFNIRNKMANMKGVSTFSQFPFQSTIPAINNLGHTNFNMMPDIIGQSSNQMPFKTYSNHLFHDQYASMSPLERPIQYYSEGSPDSRFSYHRTSNLNAIGYRGVDAHKTFASENVPMQHNYYNDSSEVPVKYCTEYTPDGFSKGSSLSSLSILNSEEGEGFDQKLHKLFGIDVNMFSAIISDPKFSDQTQSADPTPADETVDRPKKDKPVVSFQLPSSLLTSTPNKPFSNSSSMHNGEADEMGEDATNESQESDDILLSSSEDDSSYDLVDLGMPKSRGHDIYAKRKHFEDSSQNQARDLTQLTASTSKNESSFFCDTETNNTVIHKEAQEDEDLEVEDSLLVEKLLDESSVNAEHREDMKSEEEPFPGEEMVDDDGDINKCADAINDFFEKTHPDEISQNVKTALDDSQVIPFTAASEPSDFLAEKKSSKSKFNVFRKLRNSIRKKKERKQ